MRYIVSTMRTVWLALILIGVCFSPMAWDAIRLIAVKSDTAVAEYRLRQVPADRYVTEITSALDSGDPAMARSLVALADRQKVTLPAELRGRVAALPAVDLGDLLKQGYDCIFRGDFESEAGFACVVLTDFTGVGDARDVIGEGVNYVTGKPVSYLTLGLATAGLGLTAATIGSGGVALPLRAGASFLKGMNKLGKLPPRLVADVGRALSRGFDGAALNESIDLLRQFRLADAGAPLTRLFRPKALEAVIDLGSEFGSIYRVGGVRAMKASLESADSLNDVKRLSRVADHYGDGYLGVTRLLGKAAIRLADLVLTIAGWMLTATIWAFAATSFLVRTAARGLIGTWRFGHWAIAKLSRAAAPLSIVTPTYTITMPRRA